MRLMVALDSARNFPEESKKLVFLLFFGSKVVVRSAAEVKSSLKKEASGS